MLSGCLMRGRGLVAARRERQELERWYFRYSTAAGAIFRTIVNFRKSARGHNRS